MSKSEGEIQKEILKYAKQHNKIAFIDRANSGKVRVKGGYMQLHEVGTPDLLGYSIDGKFIGIEIKDEKSFNSKNNGASDEQIKRLSDMDKHLCYCGIACCVEHVDIIMRGK